ncbi:MAG: FAD-binding protein, partial [Hyphomicrobiaceae bacterium]|nr:FAD-binding protein [Hyphomicrobiaceae bacterium]
PTELVMAAQAGTAVSEIEHELAQRGQMLAFEPVDMGPVLGSEAGKSTIGGVFSCNLSGSRRVALGAARDHLLGVYGVAGSGERFNSGGRVLKNVTGYDLCRAVTGSWGTLAVLVETAFKVLPMPEETNTLVMLGLADEIAVEALCASLQTPFEVTGAVHLDQPLAQRLWHDGLRETGAAITAIRLENFSSFLPRRIDRLKDALKHFGEVHVMGHDDSLAFWGELRQLSVLQRSEKPLWRISTAAKRGADVVHGIRRYMEVDAYYDWAGGLIWLEVPQSADAGATDIRRVLAAEGGYATLIRAKPEVRGAIDVFQPMDPAIGRMTQAVKRVFDPAGILNPGRMYAGM